MQVSAATCDCVFKHTLVHVCANAAHQLSYFQVHALLEDISYLTLTNKSSAQREVLINGGLSLNLSSSLCLSAVHIIHPLSWSPKSAFLCLSFYALDCISVMQHALWATQECPWRQHSGRPSQYKPDEWSWQQTPTLGAESSPLYDFKTSARKTFASYLSFLAAVTWSCPIWAIFGSNFHSKFLLCFSVELKPLSQWCAVWKTGITVTSDHMSRVDLNVTQQFFSAAHSNVVRMWLF